MMIFDQLHRLDLRALPPWERAAVRTIQFVQATWQQMSRDRVLIRASGLAYSSLLAAVPLVAVAFAMFSAFDVFEDVKAKVQEFLFSQFLPASQAEIAAYLNQFADSASKLGLIGFLVLVLTAILLLDGIESNFNDIWHVTTRRRLIAKITSYTSVLVFGTLLLGASLTMSARIKAIVYRDIPFDPGTVERIGSWLFPLSLTILAFLLMYLVIPFTRVRLKSALLGALVGGVLWELAKNGFASSIGVSVRYSAIYGSLALVPLLLIWIYITWIIVLLGLEIAFTHQHFAALVRSRAVGRHDAYDSVATGLRLFLQIARRFHEGLQPPTADELSRRFLVATGAVDSHLARLESAGLLRRVQGEGAVPARSLDEIRVTDVIAAYLRASDDEIRRRPIELTVQEALGRFRSAGFAAVEGETVRDLVDRLADVASGPPGEGAVASA